MEFNAFTAGVEPGGLNNIEQIKLLIFYLLKVCGTMPKKIMLEATQKDGLVNYFEMANAISVMIESEHIALKIDDDSKTELLELLPSGLKIIDYLENNLPRSVKEKALNAALELITELKREKETVFTFEKDKDCSYMICTITDGSLELATIKLLIPDKQAYDLLKRRFISTDPSLIYRSIVALMTGDIESFTEYFN